MVNIHHPGNTSGVLFRSQHFKVIVTWQSKGFSKISGEFLNLYSESEKCLFFFTSPIFSFVRTHWVTSSTHEGEPTLPVREKNIHNQFIILCTRIIIIVSYDSCSKIIVFGSDDIVNLSTLKQWLSDLCGYHLTLHINIQNKPDLRSGFNEIQHNTVRCITLK